uniref:Uncharacterized protein n=1 Tax=Fagus sylvatica TaxID=28930 RepID=A0A2N9FYD5_FAGSY
MEGAPNDGTSADPTMTPIERQMQVIATSIQDLARETSRQNQELWQAIRKGPPTPHDNNQPPPRGGNRSNDQEADSHQVTRRRGDEAERTPPRSRHRAESAGSSAPPSQHKTAKTTRSSKQPERPDRSSKQPEREDRQGNSSRQPDRPDRSTRDPDDKTTRLEKELREMRKQMGDMKNSLRAKAARNLDNLVHRADSPFIPSIADFPLPSRFKVPLLENFDGTKDPFDYLEAFKTIMQLQAVPEEVMCRAFPLGLRGSARVWFNKLESESIGSFVQLSRAFIDHFIGSQRRGRPPTHLLSVKQMEGESLRTFVHRFNGEAMKIDRPKEDVTVTAFMAGLRKGDFLYELCKDPPETMSELMYEATKHMNAEDALEAMDDPPPKRRKEVEDRKPEPSKQKVPKFTETPERKRTTAPPVKFSSFTPLNTPIDKLLLQIQDDPSLRWPGKIRSDPNSRPKNLYCRFHRDHGHLTEECVALKEQVETLIRQGKLQKYVNRPTNTRPAKPPVQREQAEPNRPGPVGEIRTIVGGPASGGTSRASRKAYARQVHNIMVVQRPPKNIRLDDQIISFSEEDARGTHQPHDDALVITINIAGFTTRRVMVDNGSSADILYLPAYQQMQLDKDKLRPMDAPLVGFTGDKICPVGIVTLPIMVGTHPKTVSKTVDFLVVNCPSAYNAIIGRPTLNRLRAVTSTYHLLLKFPTEHGIGEVRGDQVAARECYLASLGAIKKRHPSSPAEGLFCYKVMPFGLKNAGATYQRLMNRMFHDQIGRNVEVYVDDMLVKSKEEDGHLDDLRETFQTLRKYQMKLNPSKCAFGVYSGKFLGFMVSQRGIEANPDKIKAILEMQPPKNIKEKAFEWTDECQQAFEELKKYLTEPPLLSPSKQGEELYLYLAVSPTAVSSALIREEERRQLPVYYTSRALRGAEERYPPMEKLAFALVTAARKLRPYFQAHTIVLLTNHPLRKAMSKPDAAGRLIQWSIELSEFDIDYRPRTAIKAQALADFIAEFTSKDDEPTEDVEQTSKWTVNIDGSSTKDSGGVGVVLRSPEGDIIKQAIRLQYPTTNNEAEYEALLVGLKTAKILGATELDVRSDSQLVVGQVNGDYEAKEGRMQQYLQLVRHQISQFHEVRLCRVPREQNTEADQLAKSASSSTADDKIKTVQQSSLRTTEVNPIHAEISWMTPIISYLREGTLPDNRHEARRLKVRASRFLMLQGTLYKRGFSLPYLRCLAPDEANYVMRGNTRRCLRRPLRRTSFTKKDRQSRLLLAIHERRHLPIRPTLRQMPTVRQPLTLTPDGTSTNDGTLALRTTTGSNSIIPDSDNSLRNWASTTITSSPGHPQANGQVEVTNRSLLKLIKTRLEGAKGLWPEELPSILWAYRTTVRIPTGETPFRMTFGSEAVVPVEIGLTSFRTLAYDGQKNEEQLRLNLDLIDEVRETAEARMKRYQEKMARHYNSRVKPRQLSIGDLVLRKVTLATRNPSEGKLGPNWEGPYKVVEVRRPGTYHLEDMNGRRLSHPWNAEHLRRYYP